eukprot:10916118-Alexandrium_andersonii.AAC.1
MSRRNALSWPSWLKDSIALRQPEIWPGGKSLIFPETVWFLCIWQRSCSTLHSLRLRTKARRARLLLEVSPQTQTCTRWSTAADKLNSRSPTTRSMRSSARSAVARSTD